MRMSLEQRREIALLDSRDLNSSEMMPPKPAYRVGDTGLEPVTSSVSCDGGNATKQAKMPDISVNIPPSPALTTNDIQCHLLT